VSWLSRILNLPGGNQAFSYVQMTCTNASVTETGKAVRPESPIPPPNRKLVYRRLGSNCKFLYRQKKQ
jgi:hypothetical protein